MNWVIACGVPTPFGTRSSLPLSRIWILKNPRHQHTQEKSIAMLKATELLHEKFSSNNWNLCKSSNITNMYACSITNSLISITKSCIKLLLKEKYEQGKEHFAKQSIQDPQTTREKFWRLHNSIVSETRKNKLSFFETYQLNLKLIFDK